jgi:translation initiation factor 5A
MSEVKLAHAGSLKSGSYLLIDGAACIVKDTQTSRPGKHGHAKVRIKATDIITGSTKEVVKPGHDSVEVPIIYKKNGQILSITGTVIELMDMETFETLNADVNLADEELKDKLEAGQTVLFWLVTGKVLIKQITEATQ